MATLVRVPVPPMGWNSFDGYGCYLYEQAAMANLEAMADRFKPAGYEYFVIDNGWFAEYQLRPGTMFPMEKHADRIRIDIHGRPQPSQVYFPNGLQPLIDRCHALGLKFGLHIMRGIPRIAVEQNCSIPGTRFTAADVADTSDTCWWCHYMFGVNINHPAAQAWYDTWIGMLAHWGVDFIKADDITAFPREVEAVANAISKSGRPIVLSLSPGGQSERVHLPAYRRANMLRITHDIWDNRKSLQAGFEAWHRWSHDAFDNFFIDLDMIPFGQLQLQTEPTGDTNTDDQAALAGEGPHRWCRLTDDQQRTFITQRAMSASPLFIGGDLPSMDARSLRYLTHPDMLTCNRNGVVGRRVFQHDSIEIWHTPSVASEGGWIGVFNRHESQPAACPPLVTAELNHLTSNPNQKFHDIWLNQPFDPAATHFTLPPDGVLFLRYRPV